MEDARSPLASAVREAYRRGEEDETLAPLVLTDTRGTAGGTDRPGGMPSYSTTSAGSGKSSLPAP